MSTNWETADVLKAPMEVCWQFDYSIGIDKLRTLYSKSKQAQWDAEQDIDWSVSIDPSRSCKVDPDITRGFLGSGTRSSIGTISITSSSRPSRWSIEFTLLFICGLLF